MGPSSRCAFLVLNAGSSTLKASVLEVDPAGPRRATAPLDAATVSWGSDASRATGRDDHLRAVLDRFTAAGIEPGALAAVGHRVVHGGERFTDATLIDDATLAQLQDLSTLAPLHNPVALDTIRAARVLLPSVAHVAAFDTAFHATLPDAARTYPIPQAWRTAHGVRRFGFHGLSVDWSVGRAAELLGPPRRRAPARRRAPRQRLLGHGRRPRRVRRHVDGLHAPRGADDGHPLGLDRPGIPLHLEREGLADAAAIGGRAGARFRAPGRVRRLRGDAARPRGGGGRRPRARPSPSTCSSGPPPARSPPPTTSLDRLDALVFTGGIGEHDAATRSAVVARLALLGFLPLPDRPADEDADARISAVGATPIVLRIVAREDVVIADQAVRAVASSA